MPRKKLSTAPLIKQIEEQAHKIATLEGTIRTIGREHGAFDEEHDRTVDDLRDAEDEIDDLKGQLEVKEALLKDSENHLESIEGEWKAENEKLRERVQKLEDEMDEEMGKKMDAAKAFLRALGVNDFEQAVCSDATDPVQALGNLRARRAA
jgi:chromosome segregation ATPase